MANYEIEIKSLLGGKEAAEALIVKMGELDSNLRETGKNSQLNHYFVGGDKKKLLLLLEPFFTPEQETAFKEILNKGKDFSLRSRQKDNEVLLVIKAALDGGTSANTVSRLEFEESLGLTLEELDALLEAAGFTHQAKWSRDRVEYAYKDIVVCIDKNAGYGYLAEFETVTTDEATLPKVRETLISRMTELGVGELSQDRLTRMFDYYNKNWRDYYGTDKTFNIE